MCAHSECLPRTENAQASNQLNYFQTNLDFTNTITKNNCLYIKQHTVITFKYTQLHFKLIPINNNGSSYLQSVTTQLFFMPSQKFTACPK